MSLKSKIRNGCTEYYDSITFETIHAFAPFYFREDFVVNALDTAKWGTRDTGGATEALVEDGPGGIFELALTSTNEVQLAGIDWGDKRGIALNKKPIIEFRARFTVIPTGAAVAVFGLCGDHNAAVNTLAESIWFRLDGSGAVTVETDDTSHETSQVATGVMLVANAWHNFQIDCSDPADVQFWIDGVRKASGTTFNMSQVAALALQPVARIGKESAAATVGTMQVDAIRIWQHR